MKKINVYCYMMLLLFIAACNRQTNIATGNQKRMNKHVLKTYDFTNNGYEVATVKVYNQDGCNLALVLKNGESIEPDLIPTKLSKNNMRVWVKYTKQPAKASLCKLGSMVKVIDIQKRMKK